MCSLRAGWNRRSQVTGQRSTIPVAIALGSNLGDRSGYLTDALAALAGPLHDIHASRFFNTEPVGVGEQPRFLNAAAVGLTTLSAGDLLATLLDIESRFGRERPHAGAARTLDLDLILYGRAVMTEAGLVVPHPRFRNRRFVLEPLAEVAAEWVDPVTGKTVGELLAETTRGGP